MRACWRLLRMVVHGLHGLAIICLVFPRLSPEQRQARVGWWSLRTLGVLGVRHEPLGRLKPGPQLLVANHISWLDIMAVHAVCPQARFVSKADVRKWPLLSRLVDGGGTLYIVREQRRDALRVVHQIAQSLAAGQTVAVFPEGTTGAGPLLLPFHANLLQAAIAAGVDVQPLALRYLDRQAPFSPAVQYLGNTSLAQSLWMIARAEGLTVRVMVLDPQAWPHAERRTLARQLRESMQGALDKDARACGRPDARADARTGEAAQARALP